MQAFSITFWALVRRFLAIAATALIADISGNFTNWIKAAAKGDAITLLWLPGILLAVEALQKLCRSLGLWDWLRKYLGVVGVISALVLLAVTPSIAANTDDQSSTFDMVIAGAVHSFLSNLSWSTGYVQSFEGDKSGMLLDASRTIHTFDLGKYSIPLDGDLFATLGRDSIVGFGLSADLTDFISLKAGISYLPGGYGWSWSVTPVSINF
ncbi:MAG: hypothetical protein ABFD49_11095 [Armatimonadota bacterium]|nr:hypothetical protein [bacterium]